jgi:hypothetical protein
MTITALVLSKFIKTQSQQNLLQMIDIYKNKLHISARSMRGEVKESRIVYKSKWLEVYEDLLSVNEMEKRNKKMLTTQIILNYSIK